MAETITDKFIKNDIERPASGNRIIYDEEVKGFGVRVTSAGATSFILNYRAAGRERRITIGSCSDWKTTAAREHAKQLKKRIDLGEDPMGDRHAEREAPTVEDLADRFIKEHLPKRRPATSRDYQSLIRLYVRPHLGKIKVAALRHSDIEKMHRDTAKTAPYQANRATAVLSKMLSLAVKWEMRMLAARWAEFDLKAGVWTKPSAHTKQKKEHRVPLSAPARALLAEMRAEADAEIEKAKRNKLKYHDEFVFPGLPEKHLTEIKRIWLAVCIQAGLAKKVEKTDAKGKVVKDAKGEPVLVWQATARIHDLRHSYASILASSGMSLPIIGALLGHTQAATTARYAHLLDDPLRAATERVGAVVTGAGKPSAEVVQIGEKRA